MSLVFSYSLLDTFHNVCPRQAYGKFIARNLKSTYTQTAGIDHHKALEDRMRRGDTLPDDLMKVEPLCAGLKARAGLKVALEISLGLTRDGRPTGFFSRTEDTSPDTVWLRGKPDLFAYGEGQPFALMLDWKTGKPRDNALQHEITAVLAFAHYPRVHNIKALNVYTKTGAMGPPHLFDRIGVPMMLAHIRRLTEGVEQALAENAWPARPGPLCGWCADFACEHNTNKEKGNG